MTGTALGAVSVVAFLSFCCSSGRLPSFGSAASDYIGMVLE